LSRPSWQPGNITSGQVAAAGIARGTAAGQSDTVSARQGSASRRTRWKSAIRHFRNRPIALNPDDVDSRYWIGGVKHKTGDIDAARASYVAAEKIRPLVRRQSIKTPADFRLLALYAPYSRQHADPIPVQGCDL